MLDPLRRFPATRGVVTLPKLVFPSFLVMNEAGQKGVRRECRIKCVS